MRRAYLRKLAVFLLDVVCVGISYALGLFARFGTNLSASERISSKAIIAILLVMVIALDLIWQVNKGFMKRSGAREVVCSVDYNVALLIGIAVCSLVFKVEPFPSRLLLLYFLIIDSVIMSIGRWLAKAISRAVLKDQRLASPIVMILNPEVRDNVERLFRTGMSYGIKGVLEIDRGHLRGTVNDTFISCDSAEFSEVLRDFAIDRPPDIFICAPREGEHEIAQIVNAAESFGAVCHIGVDVPYPGIQGARLGYFGEMPVVTYATGSGRMYRTYLKRAIDIVFSLAVLVLFCWLYLITAIVIKIDDPEGPVFFKQTRIGKDGKPFTMWKFRSMYADAEDRLAELQQYNEKDGPVFKIKNDPRITRVGHFIRKTSIDEMPQFFNVLKGDMSIVGPRPALPKEVEQYTPYQNERLLAKPGLTCYWQVQANRDSISFDEWVDLDLLYVRQCSFKVDVALICRTVGVVLTGQGS